MTHLNVSRRTLPRQVVVRAPRDDRSCLPTVLDIDSASPTVPPTRAVHSSASDDTTASLCPSVLILLSLHLWTAYWALKTNMHVKNEIDRLIWAYSPQKKTKLGHELEVALPTHPQS